MAPTSTSSKSTTGNSTAAKSAAKDRTTTGAKAAAGAKPSNRISYLRQTGERAVDVPVGAVLTASERINGAVEPWTRTESRSRELKDLRSQVKTELGRFERRGGQARRKAGGRVAATRTRVGDRMSGAQSAIQRGRDRVGEGLKKAQSTVQARVPSLR